MDTSVPQPVNFPRKQCTTCEQFFPATLEYFHSHYTTFDRLRPQCKECRSKIAKDIRKKNRPDVAPQGYKQCGKCKEIKPATTEFFSPAKRYAYGVSSQCKKCTNQYIQERRAAKRKPPIHIPQLGYKICNLCKQEFPATDYYFSIRRDLKDGLSARCKQCINSLQNTRRLAKNPRDFVLEGYKQCTKCKNCYPESTKYFTKHKNGLNPLCKDCKNVRDKQYRDTHKEQTRASIRKSEEKYKDRVRARAKVKQDKRRAFLANVSGKYTSLQIEEQLKRQNHRCYYVACGHANFEKRNGHYVYHIDHTCPLSRVADSNIPANDISYLVLTCPSCNISKGNKFPWEWPQGGRLL
jgi:hypothetical protein